MVTIPDLIFCSFFDQIRQSEMFCNFFIYHDHLLIFVWGSWPPILRRLPYFAYPSPPRFQILSNHPFPVAFNLHPYCFFVVLFLWLSGWSCHISYIILLNDAMYLHISSLGTFVPEGPYCVFYAIRLRGLTHNVVFCWYSDLISHAHTHAGRQAHTHTHTENTVGPID